MDKLGLWVLMWMHLTSKCMYDDTHLLVFNKPVFSLLKPVQGVGKHTVYVHKIVPDNATIYPLIHDTWLMP